MPRCECGSAEQLRAPGEHRAAVLQTRAPVLRPAHLVGVFSINNPLPHLAVATELEELVFDRRSAVGAQEACRSKRDPSAACRRRMS
jgi:hypothetical protein